MISKLQKYKLLYNNLIGGAELELGGAAPERGGTEETKISSGPVEFYGATQPNSSNDYTLNRPWFENLYHGTTLNELTEIVITPDSLRQLSGQEIIVRNLAPDLFRGLSNLAVLRIFGTLIKDIPARILEGATKLHTLDLFANNLEKLSLDFSTVPELCTLDLRFNRFNSSGKHGENVDELVADIYSKLSIYKKINFKVEWNGKINLEHMLMRRKLGKYANQDAVQPLHLTKEFLEQLVAYADIAEIIESASAEQNDFPEDIPEHIIKAAHRAKREKGAGDEDAVIQRNIVCLDLSNLKIASIEDDIFDGDDYKHVRVLFLNTNLLTQFNPKILSNLHALEELYLHQNMMLEVDNIGEFTFSDNPKLTLVTVYDNNFVSRYSDSLLAIKIYSTFLQHLNISIEVSHQRDNRYLSGHLERIIEEKGLVKISMMKQPPELGQPQELPLEVDNGGGGAA